MSIVGLTKIWQLLVHATARPGSQRHEAPFHQRTAVALDEFVRPRTTSDVRHWAHSSRFHDRQGLPRGGWRAQAGARRRAAHALRRQRNDLIALGDEPDSISKLQAGGSSVRHQQREMHASNEQPEARNWVCLYFDTHTYIYIYIYIYMSIWVSGLRTPNISPMGNHRSFLLGYILTYMAIYAYIHTLKCVFCVWACIFCV